MGAPTRHRGRSRYPTRSRNAGATGAAPATFNPLTDWTTDPVHGVWASDPLWTPPADGGAVASWRNGGTVAGVNLTQATGSKQPTYRASTAALNNKPTVQGDGTDDFLAADTANFAQPVFILMVAAQGRPTTANEALADRYATPGVQSLYTEFGGVFANQWQSSNAIAAIRGGTSNNSPHLFRMVSNGASSTLHVDETLIGTGNFATGDFNGVYLFSATGGTAYFSSGHIAYWAAFNSDPTAQAEWATFKAWVASTYGITVA